MLAADPRYGKPRLLMLPDGPSGVFVASYAVKGADGAVPGRSRRVMVDPATLAIQGERIWGQPGLSRPLLMPTLFHLHRYLLAGETGKTITGITGMLMLLTTLGGLLLWLPAALGRPAAGAHDPPRRLTGRASTTRCTAPAASLSHRSCWWWPFPAGISTCPSG